MDYSGSVDGFLKERLEFYLKEVRGYAYDVVNAVLAAGSDDLADAEARAEAVTKVRPSADFESISVAFKRMKNILRQATEAGKKPAETLDREALPLIAKDLADQIGPTGDIVKRLSVAKKHSEALQELSKLRPWIDHFFEKIMVMVEDERVRSNQLALLRDLLREFSAIADFSEIVTEGKV